MLLAAAPSAHRKSLKHAVLRNLSMCSRQLVAQQRLVEGQMEQVPSWAICMSIFMYVGVQMVCLCACTGT